MYIVIVILYLFRWSIKFMGFLFKYMYSMFSFGKIIIFSGKEGLYNGKLSKYIIFDISIMYMKVLKKKWYVFFLRFIYWNIEFLINVL